MEHDFWAIASLTATIVQPCYSMQSIQKKGQRNKKAVRDLLGSWSALIGIVYTKKRYWMRISVMISNVTVTIIISSANPEKNVQYLEPRHPRRNFAM